MNSGDRKFIKSVHESLKPHFWLFVYVSEYAARTYDVWRYDGLLMKESSGKISGKHICHWATRHGIMWLPYNEAYLGHVMNLVRTPLTKP